MTCPRCASRMLLAAPMRFQAEFLQATEKREQDLYRCVNCGHYSDSTIRSNRLHQSKYHKAVVKAEAIALWHSLTAYHSDAA